MRIFFKKLIGILLLSLLSPAFILAQEPEGLLLTGLFTDSADAKEQDVLREGVAETFNVQLVWTYDQTDIITGPLEALTAAKDIASPVNGLEEPLLSEISGYQKKVIAHSAGVITAISLAKQGKLWGDELYIVSPPLTSQGDLRQVRDLTSEGKGFKKIIVYTGDDMIPNFKELRINFMNYIVQAKITENWEISLNKIVYEDRGQEVNILEEYLKDYLIAAKAQLGKEPTMITIYGDIPGNKIEIKWDDGTVEFFNLQKDSKTGEDFQDEEGIKVIPLYERFPHGRTQLEWLEKFYKEHRRMPAKEDLQLFKELSNKSVSTAKAVATQARDPNELFVSPEGDVRPGDKLTYTINYENEGEGIAYGVYFTDTLEEDLDDSSLKIGPVTDAITGNKIGEPGIYNPNTRTISWFVGEVGSKQGGSTEFSVNVKEDTPDGNEIINFATVYFPSVPETTRTNGTVNRVTTYIDNIAPETIASITPQPNDANWNNTDVTINLTSTDNEAGTGVKEINYKLTGAETKEATISADTTQIPLTTEGKTTLTYWAVDNAGNIEVSKSLEIKLDKTLPTITTTTAPEPNSSGWNNTDVTISFTATDNLSGVASVTEPATITTEGANQQIGGEVVDLASNKATTSVTVNLDKTPPQLYLELKPTHPSKNKKQCKEDSSNFYKLIYSANDTLSGLKNLEAGLAVIPISNFKIKLKRSKHLEITIDEKHKEIKIKAPKPNKVLKDLQDGLFNLKNEQILKLKLKPNKLKWIIEKTHKAIEIKSPSIIFRAITSDIANNTTIKELKFNRR